MTTAESGERAILRILAEHLEVTKALLESYSRVALAVRKNPALAQNLPAFHSRMGNSTNGPAEVNTLASAIRTPNLFLLS